MLIAHVIDSLEVGGAEAVVAALCRSHVAAGHRVEVHCLVTTGRLADELQQEGIRVQLHASTSGRGSTWKLFAALRHSRPDVVHCHNKNATIRAAAAARLCGARAIVSTRHGLGPVPFRFRTELTFWVVASILCDRVVAVCDAAHRNLTAGAWPVARKVVTIHNGASLHNRVGQPPIEMQGFTLVSVGRLERPKDFDTLLRAVALTRTAVPDVQLWILGDGRDLPTLRRLSAELQLESVVRFCGERRDVERWLQAADVFVLSSTSEGLPISMLEAMAAGLPAVVTAVGALPELVALSGAGRTVPPQNVTSLARALVNYARDRHRLRALGERAQRCYQAHFTPERMAGQYLALYRACMRGGATA